MKVFEDYFTELQADMVSICLEYCNSAVDHIYIYGSREGKTSSSDAFFEKNNKFAKRYEINNLFEVKSIDIGKQRQLALLKIMTEDIMKIEETCKTFNKPVPTEIKLYYDVNKNSLRSTYSYENKYSDDPDKLPNDVFNEWFDEISNR